MNASLWLIATLGIAGLFGGRHVMQLVLRPQRGLSDAERIMSAFALFAASWATGYAIFEA